MLYRVCLRKKGHVYSIILKSRTRRIIDFLGYIAYSSTKLTKTYCINLEKFVYWYNKGINLRRSNNLVVKYFFFLLCLKGIKKNESLLQKTYFRKKVFKSLI
jgi:hypothetical protein